jgi:hypothetical protein
LSLATREEHILRESQNMEFREVSGPKRDDVTKDRIPLHDGNLYNIYSSLNSIRMFKTGRIRRMGNVVSTGKEENL